MSQEVAWNGHADRIERCPVLGVERKTSARREYLRFWPLTDIQVNSLSAVSVLGILRRMQFERALPQVGDMIRYERWSSVSKDRSYLTL